MSPQPHIIVVGAGISGMMSALTLLEEGVNVTLLSFSKKGKSDGLSTRFGFSASGKEDEILAHQQETLSAGEFLVNTTFVSEMVKNAFSLGQKLQKWGVPFACEEDGSFQHFLGEGQKQSRTLHAGLTTGFYITKTLEARLKAYEADGLLKHDEEWEFLSLIKNSHGRACGLVAQSRKNFEIKSFAFDAAIFCTGGIGGLFQTTTQPAHACGVAVSRLWQEGALLANPEFIQWHPFCLEHAGQYIGMGGLARKENARFFVTRAGKPFYLFEELYPAYKNSLPSLVALRTLKKYFKTEDLGCQADFSSARKDFFKEGGALLGSLNSGRPFFVKPAVTYWPGGLWVDQTMQTSLAGVFAAGECQYQGHGANALEDNILLSSLFSGVKAAKGAAAYIAAEGVSDSISQKIQNDEEARQRNIQDEFLNRSGRENPWALFSDLKQDLSDGLGLVRDLRKLQTTQSKVLELKEKCDQVFIPDKNIHANDSYLMARAIKDMVLLGQGLIAASIARKESRGWHYRSDFPRGDDDHFMKISRVVYDEKQGPVVGYEDVGDWQNKLSVA
ncbi:MAG TPA: hypothetical protein DDW49_00515 [Deltaproteobacteria bacterium]|nr:MAG: hypothetical protein A2048_04135 [Deltaproteobacteria bacterium GWA2_45_12]HBF11869.1 hypothetical protein [Deltaproteobacteria bacterium]